MPQLTPANDPLEKAQKLLDDMKKSKEEFEERTGRIIREAEAAADELERTDLDGAFQKIEQESAEKIDAAVLDYIGTLDEKDAGE